MYTHILDILVGVETTEVTGTTGVTTENIAGGTVIEATMTEMVTTEAHKDIGVLGTTAHNVTNDVIALPMAMRNTTGKELAQHRVVKSTIRREGRGHLGYATCWPLLLQRGRTTSSHIEGDQRHPDHPGRILPRAAQTEASQNKHHRIHPDDRYLASGQGVAQTQKAIQDMVGTPVGGYHPLDVPQSQ